MGAVQIGLVDGAFIVVGTVIQTGGDWFNVASVKVHFFWGVCIIGYSVDLFYPSASR